MLEAKTFYTIELPFSSINGSTWIEYRGEYMYDDWWNSSPVRFESEDAAIKAINESENYRDCSWRIVRTTVTHEVVHEVKNS